MISKIYGPISNIFSLLSSGQKRGAIKCVAVMISLAFMEIVAASLVVAMAAQITTPSEEGMPLTLLAVICLLVFVIKGGVTLLDGYVQSTWIQTIILDFQKRLATRYTKMDYAHQVTLNSGRSLSVLYSDADIYMRIGLVSVGILFSETAVFIVLMGFLLYLQPMITIILLAMFLILGALFVLYLLPIFKKWGKTVQETAQAGYQKALQLLQSYKDILIFGKTAHFIGLYMEQSKLRAEVTVKASVAQVIPRVSLEITFIAFFAGLVITFLWSGQEIAALTTLLSAYLYAGFRLLPSLNRMIIQFNNIKMSEASITRVVTELNSPYNKGVYLPAPRLKFNKNIEMKDVSFSYPGHDKNVLSNIDLIVKKGEFIGIVGETGSGKSTLLHLLLGLLLPKEGAVLIDEKYPANSHKWHSKIGYAAQNFHLIDGSIADNIAFGVPERKRDVKRINKVVKDAQIDRFVKALPNGIDTEIGEKGALVSGGERQRIALARALYQQPDVLMLDEATSALDLSTEKSIMDSVIKLKKKDLTIIAVTHRLDTLKAADRIIVIENGRIKEDIKNSKKASVKKNKGKSK